MNEGTTKRFLSAGLLFCALLLGMFDAPAYWNRLVDSVSARTAIEDIMMFRLDGAFSRPFRLGLDLVGGTHLVYRADMSRIGSGEYQDAMQALRDVIERRVNLFGVTEPVVQVETSGQEYRLIVELAGIKDVGAAIRLIGETPLLEFKEPAPGVTAEHVYTTLSAGDLATLDQLLATTPLNGKFLSRATLQFDPTTNAPMIGLQFNSDGSALFEALTEKNIGNPLVIYLDGAPISAPRVNEKISGGEAQITGQFTPEEARTLVGRLNSGALPVPISLLSQQTVEASLGRDSLIKSLDAGLYGFLAVIIFMIAWYRLPGLISVVALLMYAALTLAVFKLIPVTLSAAGIAGFILSLGIAVDANILIFERLKEEMLKGKDLEEAMREGFDRAWTSIRDSNISSLISASILYWFGTSIVQGFALTLGLGVIISMFSAITVTRTFLLAAMSKRLARFRTLFLSGFAR